MWKRGGDYKFYNGYAKIRLCGCYKILRAEYDRLSSKYIHMDTLSIGMSNDYDIALNLISTFFCFCNFSDKIFEESKEAILSLSPCIIIPEDGQGAKKLKSLKLAGGETLKKPFISGLLIKSCIATQAPNEKPATQHFFEWLLYCCIQSRTLAASLN